MSEKAICSLISLEFQSSNQWLCEAAMADLSKPRFCSRSVLMKPWRADAGMYRYCKTTSKKKKQKRRWDHTGVPSEESYEELRTCRTDLTHVIGEEARCWNTPWRITGCYRLCLCQQQGQGSLWQSWLWRAKLYLCLAMLLAMQEFEPHWFRLCETAGVCERSSGSVYLGDDPNI